MSTETQFRHVEPTLIVCDVCDQAKNGVGAIRVTRDHAETGPHIQTICDTCALEISCIVIRTYFTPDARATEPPPEPDRSGGGT